MIISIFASAINFGAEWTVKTSINPQDLLAESLDGIYLVDAGAGTGKTHTIIRRYQNIIKSGVSPANILLITFTKNASEQLKEEAIGKVSDEVNITELLEAPIMNFHSLCARILKNSGSNSPQYLGIDEIITRNFKVVENYVYELELFRKFFLNFKKATFKKYEKIYLGLNDNHLPVLRIIKLLSNRGIFPLKKEWLSNGSELLKGRREDYFEKFDELNKPMMAARGDKEKQNDFHNRIKTILSNFYLNFNLGDILTDKRVDPEIKPELFLDESQEMIIEFTRDVYHSYIDHMLKRNFLNFEFVVMFAFLILYNDDNVRKNNLYEYSMVDEFQDTDEIQFQLLMLLIKDCAGTANLAVVGDWKQGIYGFRNTTIENITEFEKRLNEYKRILNTGKDRITFETKDIKKISFEYNYRSSQEILNFSKQTLLCSAKKDEEIDIVSIENKFGEILKAKRNLNDLTEIKFYKAQEEKEDSEIELIFRKISELVNEEKYVYRKFDSDGKPAEERRIQYSDICILSRNNNFCLKLQKAGQAKKIPVNFGGMLELFSSKEGILVLAWLRLIINGKNIQAWLPVLEMEGYIYSEIVQIIKNISSGEGDLFSIPSELSKFREYLSSKKDNLLFITESILKRYDFDDNVGNSILNEVSNWLKTDLISLGELIRLINSSKTETFEIELNQTSNAVTTQTIHTAKGLEYPVVILANMNTYAFPNTMNTTNDIFYLPVPGLRFRKQHDVRGEYTAICNNWKSDVLIKMFKPDNYDEERRLLYVAVTRAKQYLYFTSYRPSKFFDELAEKTDKEIFTDLDYSIIPSSEKKIVSAEKIEMPSEINSGRKFYSVHDLMDVKNTDVNFKIDEVDDGAVYYKSNPEAIEFGIKLHQIAYKLANGFKVDSEIDEIRKLKKFISDLKANELKAEVDFLYPKDEKIIRGTIDLLAFYDDRIEVIDYKTDKNKKYLEKYKIQIEIYTEVIRSIYKDMNVKGKIFFVKLNEVIEF